MPLSIAGNTLIDALLIALIAYLQSQGMTEEEARAAIAQRIIEIEALKDLPTR
jgi:hypothetical protein